MALTEFHSISTRVLQTEWLEARGSGFLSSHRVAQNPEIHRNPMVSTMGLQMPRTTPLGMSWGSVSWFLAVQVGQNGLSQGIMGQTTRAFWIPFLGQSCILQVGLHFFSSSGVAKSLSKL